MMGTLADFLRLQALRLRIGRNLAVTGGRPLWTLVGAGLLLLSLLLYGEYRFFLKVFLKLQDLPEVAQNPLATFLVLGIVERLHNMIFLTAFSMLLFSNILTAVSAGYLSSDLLLLHSTPLSRMAVFGAKLLESTLLASYMVWMVTMPIFVAFGRAYGSASRTALWSAGILVIYSLPPAALGAMAALLLMRFVPARRAHQLLTGIGVFVVVVLVVVVRSMRPERLLNPASTEDFKALLESISIPLGEFLPSTWASIAIGASLTGARAAYLAHAGRIALLTAAAALPLYVLADLFYYRAYVRSGEGAPSGRRIARAGIVDRLARGLLTKASTSGRSIYLKDLRVFGRDSFQWSQLLMIGALIFVYLFNIRNLPVVAGFEGLNILLAYLNLGLVGFILAAISVRYAFPAVSLEGEAFWVIRSAPVDFRRYLISKLVLHLVPFLLLAETLVVTGQALLGWDRHLAFIGVGATLVMTVGLTAMGVGMGAMMPRFRFESPAQVAAGAGGITYMVLALGFVGTVLGVMFVPFFQHMHRHSRLFQFVRWHYLPELPFFAGLILIGIVTAVLPMRIGLARLRLPHD